VFVALVSSCVTVWGTPVYWDPLVGGNGHWYEPIRANTGISWDNARIAAENRGGYLATLTTSTENAFVFNLVDDPLFWSVAYDIQGDYTFADGPLFGGYQPDGSAEPDGGWQWLNGEGLFAGTGTFQNWALGEPNNYPVNLGANPESAVGFKAVASGNSTALRGNQWNDVSASLYFAPSYVIEWNVDPQYVPEPSTYAAAVAMAFLAWSRFFRKPPTGRTSTGFGNPPGALSPGLFESKNE